LRGARLEGADLRSADLQDTDLRGARLRGADFQDANLSGAHLAQTNISRKQLLLARGVDLTAILRSPVSFWQSMVLVPWAQEAASGSRIFRMCLWAIGWIWAVVGLFVGSMFASYYVTLLPSIVRSYHDIFVTIGAVVGGLLIQAVGLGILLLLPKRGDSIQVLLLLIGSAMFPLLIAGFGIYWFLTRLGPERGLVGQGFVYGLILKLFLLFAVPLIKNLLWGIPMALGLRALGLRRRQIIEVIDRDDK